jgi:hypothetical protein
MNGARVLAGALVFRHHQQSSAAAAAAPFEPTIPVETSGSAASVTSAPVPSVTVTAAPVIEADTVVDAGPVHVPTVTKVTSTGTKSNRSSPRSTAVVPTAPPVDDCSTPYWYDAQNVKHYKEHCLKK